MPAPMYVGSRFSTVKLEPCKHRTVQITILKLEPSRHRTVQTQVQISRLSNHRTVSRHGTVQALMFLHDACYACKFMRPLATTNYGVNMCQEWRRGGREAAAAALGLLNPLSVIPWTRSCSSSSSSSSTPGWYQISQDKRSNILI